MIRFIIFVGLLSTLVSCGQTEDFILAMNEAPQINFTENSELPLLTDSIKVSLKNSQQKYNISLSVTDKNYNISEVRYNQVTGVGKLWQLGELIIDNNIIIESDVLDFDYYPESAGLHKFKLTVVDNFDSQSSVHIELIAFDNIKPVAIIKIGKLGKLDKYEYSIFANESFDPDQKYGGGIAEYEYRVLGKIHPTFKDHYEIIFPSPGVYNYGVRVKDNDGRWSEIVEKDVSVD